MTDPDLGARPREKPQNRRRSRVHADSATTGAGRCARPALAARQQGLAVLALASRGDPTWCGCCLSAHGSRHGSHGPLHRARSEFERGWPSSGLGIWHCQHHVRSGPCDNCWHTASAETMPTTQPHPVCGLMELRSRREDVGSVSRRGLVAARALSARQYSRSCTRSCGDIRRHRSDLIPVPTGP